MLFIIGVPVIAHLLCVYNANADLQTPVLSFLIIWASSKTILLQDTVNKGHLYSPSKIIYSRSSGGSYVNACATHSSTSSSFSFNSDRFWVICDDYDDEDYYIT